MANGGKDVRLGDDKRPVSLIPGDTEVLYNIANGAVLTDAFGNPLVTEVDNYNVADVTMAKATSVNFTSKDNPYFRIVDSVVATGLTAICANLDVEVGSNNNPPLVLRAHGAGTVGVGTILPQVDGNNVTWYDYSLYGGPGNTGAGVTNGTLGVATDKAGYRSIYNPVAGDLAEWPIVRVNSDLGSRRNVIYIDNVGIFTAFGATVGDRIESDITPDGTIISDLSHNSRVVLSNDYTGITTNLNVRITRSKPTILKSNATWKIAEQFKESSEVSSTLLGVNRAETQLSLFSNVSSYGIDTDEFEVFSFNGGRSISSWETRANLIYGSRYRGRSQEETRESGIKLEAFPTPYTYPFGPKYDRVGLYNATVFTQYRDFIEMGNDLHAIYNSANYSSYPQTWKDRFLPDTVAKVVVGTGELDNDVQYTAGIATSFARIDTWTDTWRDLGNNELKDPVTEETLTFASINQILRDNGKTSDRTGDNTRPGYSVAPKRYALMQSRRVFRYQPGRISGFTFGVRTSEESRDGSYIEWGITNPTDQYVFRIDKGNISIIRRSTIPLSSDALKLSGMTQADQVNITTGNVFDADSETGEPTTYWTTEIPREKWSGDRLNGNGPSKHTLRPTNVSMYKIEFGWYGAIGARFYAYVPVGNGEARWVVLHTIVIENQMGEPCLQDSYFRLTYTVDVYNQAKLKTPQYIVKYGASYYIDGGDEGTVQIYSTSSGLKTISGISSETTLAVKPKDVIYNNQGVGIPNKKIIMPTKMNVSSDSLAEVKTVVCKACPGFGHVHTPSINTGINGRTYPAGTITFSGEDEISIGAESEDDNWFTEEDIGAKIIAPSIYNCYIGDLEGRNVDPNTGIVSYTTAKLVGWKYIGYGTSERKIASEGVDDVPVLNRATTPDSIDYIPLAPYNHGTIRLSNFTGEVSSPYKLTGSEIEIQFANPDSQDAYGHFADFAIGVTDLEPTNRDDVEKTFDQWKTPGEVGTGNTFKNISMSDHMIFGRHNHQWAQMNEEGVELRESWHSTNPRRMMNIDYRIPQLRNPGGGYCSKVTINVEEPIFTTDVELIEIKNGLPDDVGIGRFYPIPTATGTSNYFLRLRGSLPTVNYGGGQISFQFDDPSGEIDPDTGLTLKVIQGPSRNSNTYVSVTSLTEGFTGYVDNEDDIIIDDGGSVKYNTIDDLGLNVTYTYIMIKQNFATGQLWGGTSDNTNLGPTGNEDKAVRRITNLTLAMRPVACSYRAPTGVANRIFGTIRNRKLYNYNPFPLYFVAKTMDNADINNISIKETIGDYSKTVALPLYVNTGANTGSGDDKYNTSIVLDGADAESAPTHFDPLTRLSSSEVDIQNEQPLREGFKVIDTFYVGANETKEVDMTKIFGADRNVITPDNMNLEATFVTAKKLDGAQVSDTGLIETTLSLKEQ